MKLTATLLTALTVAVASGQADSQRKLATLAEKWALQDPTFTFNANTFALTFQVTDYINTGMPQYTLWTAPGCKDTGSSIDSSNAWASKNLTENAALQAANNFNASDPATTMLDSGTFSGRAATVNAAINPQTIDTATNIYSETTTNGQLTATVSFCIRFGLWTTAALGVTTPVEVNFLETLVTLNVDLTDGFQIGNITTAPKDRLTRTANQAYEVSGYECTTTSFDPLTGDALTRARNQGEIISVCVTPDATAVADGIKMRNIDDFAFSKGATTQVAIVSGNSAPNLLTTWNSAGCIGQTYCRFSTILSAQFYQTSGTVTGAGVATMQFGSRRALRAIDGRNLQGDEAGSSEFDLSFDVAQGEADTQSSDASSTSVAVAALSFVAIAAAML